VTRHLLVSYQTRLEKVWQWRANYNSSGGEKKKRYDMSNQN
jgi:hypothetical protein